MTAEEVLKLEHHAEEVLTESYEAAKAFDVCKVYGFAKPILSIVANAWFLPKKVKLIVGDLIRVMDGVCITGTFAAVATNEENKDLV